MKNFKIYAAKTRHIDEIVKIEEESFAQPWTKDMFDAEMKNPFSYSYVALFDNKVIGYIFFWILFEELHIINISTHKSHRRKAVATTLLKLIFLKAQRSRLERYLLEVRFSNKPAISLYEKLGFKKEFIRKGYYTNPKENACIMIYCPVCDIKNGGQDDKNTSITYAY